MKTTYAHSNCEIDWYYDYNVYALNLSTLIYENTSGFDGEHVFVVKFTGDYDEEDVSMEIRKYQQMKDIKVFFALYNEQNMLCGYVIEDNSIINE